MANSPVRVTEQTRDNLTKLRLRVAADIGEEVSMGRMVAILEEYGQQHYQALTQIARKGIEPNTSSSR